MGVRVTVNPTNEDRGTRTPSCPEEVLPLTGPEGDKHFETHTSL